MGAKPHAAQLSFCDRRFNAAAGNLPEIEQAFSALARRATRESLQATVTSAAIDGEGTRANWTQALAKTHRGKKFQAHSITDPALDRPARGG